MLLRAIIAFLALPGIVAFTIPILIGASSGAPLRAPVAAAALLSLGVLLLLWCVREFYVAGRGTLAPWSPPQRLVTSGPYRFSRNPMYLAVLTILSAWCLLWRESTLIWYTLCTAAAVYVRVLSAEEPWAARQFGTQWSDYRTRVPRWLL